MITFPENISSELLASFITAKPVFNENFNGISYLAMYKGNLVEMYFISLMEFYLSGQNIDIKSLPKLCDNILSFEDSQ